MVRLSQYVMHSPVRPLSFSGS